MASGPFRIRKNAPQNKPTDVLTKRLSHEFRNKIESPRATSPRLAADTTNNTARRCTQVARLALSSSVLVVAAVAIAVAVIRGFARSCHLGRRIITNPVASPTSVALSGFNRTAAAPLASADKVRRPRSNLTSIKVSKLAATMRYMTSSTESGCIDESSAVRTLRPMSTTARAAR